MIGDPAKFDNTEIEHTCTAEERRRSEKRVPEPDSPRSKHRFQVNPDQPRQCLKCGRLRGRDNHIR